MIYKRLHRKLKVAEHEPNLKWGRRGGGRMVVGFTTTYASSAYHH